MTLVLDLDLDVLKIYLIRKWKFLDLDFQKLAPEQDTQTGYFCSCDLYLDPMTLINKLDLDILLKIKFLGQGFQKLEHEQDSHTDRHTRTQLNALPCCVHSSLECIKNVDKEFEYLCCIWYQLNCLNKKVKSSGLIQYSITSIGHGADPVFLAVSPQMTLVINPVLGCCYLPSQRDHPLGRYQIILLGDRGTQGGEWLEYRLLNVVDDSSLNLETRHLTLYNSAIQQGCSVAVGRS